MHAHISVIAVVESRLQILYFMSVSVCRFGLKALETHRAFACVADESPAPTADTSLYRRSFSLVSC